jgi:sodium/potassium/calcium exchanger 6
VDEDVVIMNDQTILDTVQRWRRKRYSARPFALTILAITLITLLALAKDYGSHVGDASAGITLGKRDLVTVQDEEVCATTRTTPKV